LNVVEHAPISKTLKFTESNFFPELTFHSPMLPAHVPTGKASTQYK